MGLPKNIKKTINLTQSKTLLARREELLDKINKDGTYLPKSLLHADLDGGFLDFVKNDLKTVVEGKGIPVVDIIITTQNWSQFTETWNFESIDKNVEPPFLTVVRNPEVKFGTNPAVNYNIPNRRQLFYAYVPTWDGQRKGVDVYTIPQPVPVDITYSVKIICNRMRELNQFNKTILEKFASRQAYTVIKGHYIPIVMNEISDESVMEIEKRKYYVQSYSFTLLGFLIDENEFEVRPGISRVLQTYEVDPKTINRTQKLNNNNPDETTLDVLFLSGNTIISQLFNYTTNLYITGTNNITSYDVYINDLYFGQDLSEIQINNGDTIRFEVTKTSSGESNIYILSKLI